MTEDVKEIIKEVTPDRTLKTLYVTYLLIVVWVGILPWLIPLAFFSSPFLTLGISLPLLLAVVFALWWIGAYYRTIRYRFTSFEISWERGVWFRQTGIVPYHRITNIDIMQGPISRFLGISLLKVQTAGYTSGTASAAELKINGISEPEILREFIRMRMQEGLLRATSDTKSCSVDEQILEELVAIRNLMGEKQS
ncbi:MAG: PH domain-containing protein [Methanoregulaceae archaeon]|nr:PH domain-containing protein [Methanoregulaceae archaeon]